MFGKILHANDGSEHAFRALALALAIAKQNRSELHVVCVEEIPFLPEFMEEVRESAGTAARYFHGVLQRARDNSRIACWPFGNEYRLHKSPARTGNALSISAAL
jgi:nucleotide-binding universal stress UspA family protein